MSTKSNRHAAVIYEDGELYKSFRRALRAVGNIEVNRFTKDSLKNKNKIVLIAIPKEEDVRGLLYSKVRSRYLNPIAIIGYKDRDLFKREHPLFRDHPYNHCHVNIPFDLVEFVAMLRSMVPISSQAIRKAICGSDPGYKGYLLKLLSHDLLSDNERCVEILILAGDHLREKDLSKKIAAAINEIKTGADWSAIASKIGKEVENKIKEVGDV